jgi:hypothetical protein
LCFTHFWASSCSSSSSRARRVCGLSAARVIARISLAQWDVKK